MSLAAIRASEVIARVGTTARVGVEVGVWRGAMSAELLRAAPSLVLHMVDSWAAPENQPEAYRATDDFHATMTEDAQLADMRRAVAAVREWSSRARIRRCSSLEAAAAWTPGTADFVFLDGDHSYEGVAADIEAWHRAVKPGGWLCGHDYHEAKNVRKNFGVCRAVDEAAERHGWSVEFGQDDTWFVQRVGW